MTFCVPIKMPNKKQQTESLIVTVNTDRNQNAVCNINNNRSAVSKNQQKHTFRTIFTAAETELKLFVESKRIWMVEGKHVHKKIRSFL